MKTAPTKIALEPVKSVKDLDQAVVPLQSSGTSSGAMRRPASSIVLRTPRTQIPALKSSSLALAIVKARQSPSTAAPRPGAPQAAVAAYRMSKFGDRFRPLTDLQQNRSACETLHQMDPTLDDYNHRLQLLEAWRVEEGLNPACSPEEIALVFLAYVDALFFSGLSHADASKTLAALQARIPTFSSRLDLVSRCKRASEGFAKRGPAGSRDPPPEEVVYAVVGALLWLDKPLEALNEFVRYLCGGRPGEIDNLTVDRLVPPQKPGGKWSILFNPRENMKPGKTGEFDEGVILDQLHLKAMGPIFQQLVAGRPGSDRLWNLSTEHMNQSFSQALKILNPENFNIVRYSWRHAAASQDLLSKSRTTEEVKARYRWKSDSSMKRYTKPARVEFFRAKLPKESLKFGEIVRTQLPAMFAG
jgi:hypothetical protein